MAGWGYGALPVDGDTAPKDVAAAVAVAGSCNGADDE